jgi:hypothetical protein
VLPIIFPDTVLDLGIYAGTEKVSEETPGESVTESIGDAVLSSSSSIGHIPDLIEEIHATGM